MIDDNDSTVFLSGQDIDKLTSKKPEQLPHASLICLDDSQLEAEQNGLILELKDKPLMIGRAKDCSGYLASSQISRKHAKVYPENGQWVIEDLGSTNGVRVNDEKIQKQIMQPNDEVSIGTIPFSFIQEVDEEDDPDQTVMGTMPRGDDNETILFTKNEAYDLLIDVQEEKTKFNEKLDETIVPRVNQTRNATKQPVKSSKIIWIVVAAVIIVNITIGGFFFYSHKKEQQTINRNYKTVKQFIYNNEANRSSRADINKEIETLKEILADLKVSYQIYPDADTLSLLEAKVRFLIFERHFKALINKNSIGKTAQLVKGMRKTLKKLQKRVSEDSKAYKGIAGIADLLDIADIIVKLKDFQGQYPDARRSSRYRPSSYQLQELKREKSRYVTLRKQKNTLLSTQYPYFKALVIKTYKDFNLIYEWEKVLN